MFEFMHKYRVLILALLFVGLFGWGAWSGIETLLKRSDEDKLLATYKVPGDAASNEIRLQEYFDAKSRIGAMFGSAQNFARMIGISDQETEQIIWDFLVLRGVARKAGMGMSEAEARNILEQNWGRKRPDAAEVEFLQDVFAVSQLRQTYMQDPGGPSFEQVWERFKNENEELKGKAVLFVRKDPSAFPLDPKNVPEDMAKLKEWWEKPENRYIASEKMVPEKLDVEVAYVPFRGKSLEEVEKEFQEKWAEPTKAFTVTDEEILERWNKLESQYSDFIAAHTAKINAAQEEENRKAKEEGREPKILSAGDQPSRFDVVKEQIRRELLLGKLFTKMLDEVKAGKSLKEVAAAYHVPFKTLEKVTVDDMMVDPEFGGPRVKQHLMHALQSISEGKAKLGDVMEYETTTPDYIKRVFDEPAAFLALYRITNRHPARPSELEEALDFAVEKWKAKQADEELRERAKAFRDALDKKVEEIAAVKEAKERLQKERDEAVAKEIQEAGLSREKPEDLPRIELIERKQDRVRDDAIAKVKREHEAAALAEVAKEQGVEVVDLGWLKKSTASPMNYSGAGSDVEKRNRFLRSTSLVYGLSALEPGKVGQPVPDPNAGITAILLLEERKAPEPSQMLQRPERVRSLAAQMAQRPGYDEWSYKNLTNERWFDLWVPHVEQNAAEREKERILREQRQERYNRQRAEDTFRRQRAKLQEQRAKEAAAPPPAQPAPGTETNPPAPAPNPSRDEAPPPPPPADPTK